MSHVPLRLCVVCRELKPRNQLFRFVRPKDVATYTPNPEGRIAGKGVYFCRAEQCLTRLQKERRLKRLFLDKLQDGGLEYMLAAIRES